MSAVARGAVLAAWVAFVLVTTRWMAWGEPVREGYALDVLQYEAVAEAAPGLPPGGASAVVLQRLPVHWTVGILSDATGLDLHATYRVATGLVLAALVLVVDRLLAPLRLGVGAYAVCAGIALTNPYTTRFYLVAPGLLGDAVFVLGTALALLGLVRVRAALVLGGLALALLARQSALPVAVVAALWVLRAGAWRAAGRAALAAYAGAVAVPLAALTAWIAVAAARPASDIPAAGDFTVLGVLDDLPGTASLLAEHVGRAAIAFPSLIALLAVVLALLLRARRLGAVPFPGWGALAVGGAVAAQPLVFNPLWLHGNETRLAALGVVPLATALGVLLAVSGVAAAWDSGRLAVVLGALVAATSLHHLYTAVPVTRGQYLGLALLASTALAVLAVLPLRAPAPADGLAAEGR
ncbi:MAG: hypothetical protein ICV64_00950 [Thermoleophilia bacterium]|nr:hypothetical protein [Thermoleophilia bacterium]